jgi:ferredoxin-NADP reductase
MGNAVRLKATVTDVTPFGSGVYQVRMRPESRIPRFKAGQFLHLTLDDFDPTSGFWPESRVFSIASGPDEESLEIVYSVKGRYTSRMEQEIAVGRSVWLKLPYGSFIISRVVESASAVILIAGGTGLSPFVPFIRDSLRKASTSPTRKVVLHYGVRSLEMLLYADLLRLAARSLAGFTWRLWVEDVESVTVDAEVPAVRKSGRLDPDVVVREDGDDGTIYFLSGPPAMIQHFRQRLRELAVSDECIQIDEWE